MVFRCLLPGGHARLSHRRAIALFTLASGCLPRNVSLSRAPYVVLAHLGTAEAAAIDTYQQAAGVFDPLASWVVHACHQRGWPAISTDPGRLRRIDPDLPIDVL
ncbi:MAG: hypothetical protein ACRDRU_19250 [Pseudonocardiaceae bacterium]